MERFNLTPTRSLNSEINASKIQEIQNSVNCDTNSILKKFPTIPFDQTIYGCYELNAEFHLGNSPDFDKNIITKHDLPIYENLTDIQAESTSLLLNPQSNVNINDRQPIFRRLMNTLMKSGVVGLLEEIKTLETRPSYFFKVSDLLLKAIDALHAPINPWLISDKEQSFDYKAIKGESWCASIIRTIEWHPHCNKYAIAFKNDVVKVYASNHSPIVLKHPKQLKVTCLAWKPYYSSIIAIGCANCIIIWDTDTSPVSIKPASSCSFLLSKRYHNDIMDIKWYPKSDFLISVASKDNQIMIWDVTLKLCVPLKRVGTTGFSICQFSSNLNKLFTADLSTTFRIWNPINYTSEKWTNLISRCNSVCWSPDGSLLLFSCYGCSLLYSLKFLNNNHQELKIVCDLSSIVLIESKYEDSDGHSSNIHRYSVGGAIENIKWDSSGQRLAITFKRYDNDMNVNVVAVFITKFFPHFQLLPCGFINECENSWPTTIAFKPKFEEGALLTIGWSNSRIQHIPFYFTNEYAPNYF